MIPDPNKTRTARWSAFNPQPLTVMKPTFCFRTGIARCALSFLLMVACGAASAAEPRNLFERIGRAISRASDRVENPSTNYDAYRYPAANSRRSQPTDKYGRPIMRISPAPQARYMEPTAAQPRLYGVDSRTYRQLEPVGYVSPTRSAVP